MIIKNLSIEMRRSNKQLVVVGLHPGTVDSHLSEPFKHHVAKDHLFQPEFAARKLLEVISQLNASHSGQCIDWEGKIIDP